MNNVRPPYHINSSVLLFPASPQLPDNARTISLSVPVDTVYPKPFFVTRTMTVQTAQMRPPALNPPAALITSSATTRCVCRTGGDAMEMLTALTGLMSGQRTVWDGSRSSQRYPAASISSSVQTGSVSAAAGSVTEAWTATMDRTRSTAVSMLS